MEEGRIQAYQYKQKLVGHLSNERMILCNIILETYYMTTTLLTRKMIASNDFNEILSHINPDNAKETLLLLDIDDNLITSKQSLGKDAWFKHFMGYLQKYKKMEPVDANEEASHLAGTINKITGVTVLQSDIPEIISTLQSMGVTILGLTSRNREFFAATTRQLKSVGLSNLVTTHKNIKSFTIDKKLHAGFKNGIIYAGDMSKGESLETVMKHPLMKPLDLHLKKRIIMMDDKESHINNILKAIDITQNHFRYVTEYVGIRYTKADSTVAKSRNRMFTQTTEIQLKVFVEHGFLLNDNQAQKVRIKKSRGEITCHILKQPSILHHYGLRRRPPKEVAVDFTKPVKRSKILQKYKRYLRLMGS